MTDEERQLYIDFKELFGSDRGKRVLANLRKVFNFDVSVIPRDNIGRTDIYEVLRNEGKRTVIIYILHKKNADLDEAKQKEAIHETEL